MWRFPRTCLVLCALACAPAEAQSIGSLNRTGSGARAAGMANAFVAVSDDGTAASWNPAGLAQLRRPELSFVNGTFDRDFSREGFRSPDGAYTYSSSASRFNGNNPEFASLAVPATLWGRPFTFQVDWRRQYQFGGRFEAELLRFPTRAVGEDLRLSYDERGSGQIDLWSLAGAVRVSRRTYLGVSGSLWRGEWDFTTSLAQTPVPPVAPSTFATTRQGQRFDGANATVGLLVDHGVVRFGAVAKSAFRADYGQYGEVVSSLIPARREELSGLKARVPWSVALGAAVRPGGGWTVALDLTRDAWSRFAVEGAPGGVDLGFFDGLRLTESATRDTVSVNLGAEKLFPRDGRVIPLRFGVAYEPQGPRDVVTRDPQDYVFLAVGSGYNTNRVKVDFAVQYGWNSYLATAYFDPEPRPSPRAHDAIGRVASREWRLKFSAIYRFTDSDKLMEKLKKVF
jgi:hypothetical protein